MLGQPLLLTGEPGVGKTQFAFSVAWELGMYPPLIFETKSSSQARDLFYTYDSLSRFHAAHTGEGSRKSLDYLTWNALGIAILRSNPEEEVRQWLPEGFAHGGQRQSVVLIDEIDKAPRDFPNDLLNEIEHTYFRVPELGNAKISAGKIGEGDDLHEFRPVLIITSNSEKHLPDAFLRRCVYYNIPFPDRTRLQEIVAAQIGQIEIDSLLLSDALDFFFRLRDPDSNLRKKPATAELIGWITALREMGMTDDQSLHQNQETALLSVSALVKSADDQIIAQTMLVESLKGWSTWPGRY
jgi:MoxR-like ATPase